jgi:hypothetical protein
MKKEGGLAGRPFFGRVDDRRHGVDDRAGIRARWRHGQGQDRGHENGDDRDVPEEVERALSQQSGQRGDRTFGTPGGGLVAEPAQSDEYTDQADEENAEADETVLDQELQVLVVGERGREDLPTDRPLQEYARRPHTQDKVMTGHVESGRPFVGPIGGRG